MFEKLRYTRTASLLSSVAIAASVFSVPMVVHVEQLRSWDAKTHIFFASGYLNDWWSLWEPRWYGGYNRASYPPLSHQMVAALARLLNDNLELSYSIILFSFLAIGPIAAYSLSTGLSANRNSAQVAAMLFAFLPSIHLMVFSHGQFAGYISLIFLMFATGAIKIFLRDGGTLNGIRAVSLIACSVASHHATPVLLLPVIAPIVFITHLSQDSSTNRLTIIKRSAILALVSISVSIVVILPFWKWTLDFKMQQPIPHPSRENFLGSIPVAKLYFVDNYQFLLLLLPLLLYWCARFQRHRLLLLGSVLLMLLGLGGTTKLPFLIFGEEWQWLTYERFSVWATIMLMPIIGETIVNLKKPSHETLLRAILSLLVGSTAIWIINPGQYRTTPAPIDLSPTINVIKENPLCLNRYLALGFSNQLPDFSTYSGAQTLDGLWHSARTDPLLRQSGIGSLSDALYWEGGDKVLLTFLQREDPLPAYCIFLNQSSPAEGELKRIVLEAGWEVNVVLENNVTLWTKPVSNDELIQITNIETQDNTEILEGLAWGTLPPLFLLLVICSHGWLKIGDKK